MVGDRRIELLTSSVSRKRSTSELTAHVSNSQQDILYSACPVLSNNI